MYCVYEIWNEKYIKFYCANKDFFLILWKIKSINALSLQSWKEYPNLLKKQVSVKKTTKKNKEFYNKTKQTPFYIFFIQSEHEGLELRFRRSSSKVYIVSFQYWSLHQRDCHLG